MEYHTRQADAAARVILNVREVNVDVFDKVVQELQDRWKAYLPRSQISFEQQLQTAMEEWTKNVHENGFTVQPLNAFLSELFSFDGFVAGIATFRPHHRSSRPPVWRGRPSYRDVQMKMPAALRR